MVQRRGSREAKSKCAAKSPDIGTLPSTDDIVKVNVCDSVIVYINEWMNLLAWQKHTVSQAGTLRHDNCVHLPVS